jgi:hypothetical protein
MGGPRCALVEVKAAQISVAMGHKRTSGRARLQIFIRAFCSKVMAPLPTQHAEQRF